MVSLQAKRLKQILSPSQARPERLNYMHAYKTYRNVRQSNATLEQHLTLFRGIISKANCPSLVDSQRYLLAPC